MDGQLHTSVNRQMFSTNQFSSNHLDMYTSTPLEENSLSPSRQRSQSQKQLSAHSQLLNPPPQQENTLTESQVKPIIDTFNETLNRLTLEQADLTKKTIQMSDKIDDKESQTRKLYQLREQVLLDIDQSSRALDEAERKLARSKVDSALPQLEHPELALLQKSCEKELTPALFKELHQYLF